MVGHYIEPTLEKWTLGFMREWHVVKEVMIWHRFAFAFVMYHRRATLAYVRTSKRGDWLDHSAGWRSRPANPHKEEVQFIRECYLSPDGWEEEKTRILAVQNAPNPQWTPPSHIEWKL